MDIVVHGFTKKGSIFLIASTKSSIRGLIYSLQYHEMATKKVKIRHIVPISGH
jgi:hypothetical protein